jgi:hypothetical protein
VGDVIDRLPQLGARAAYAKQAIRDTLIDHKEYIYEHGEDPPRSAGGRGGINSHPPPGIHEKRYGRRSAGAEVTCKARKLTRTNSVLVSAVRDRPESNTSTRNEHDRIETVG